MSKMLVPALLIALFTFIGCETEEDKRIAEEKKVQAQLLADSIHIADSIATFNAQFVHGEVQANQGLFQVLDGMGIPTESSLKIINKLRFEVELTNIKVGEQLKVRFNPADSSEILELLYQPDIVTIHKITFDTTTHTYEYSLEELPTEMRNTLIEGMLSEGSTLDQTLREIGIPNNMVGIVNGVLKCKINFRMFARHGDTFKILLRERYYNDTRISSRVLYTTYSGEKTGSYEAFKFEDSDPKSTYNAHYTETGEALIHSGLRYPVGRLHITSGWGWRRHPVTGKKKMHNGVDYKGGIGDPVYAVAAGTVISSAYDEYSGNKIGIRHSDKSTSYYLHLSKRMVNKGQYVRTRQRIGSIGKTGRVTGPHLHFGFKNNRGRWMNPLRKRMIATPKLTGEKLALLKEQVIEIRKVLDSTQAVNLSPQSSEPIALNTPTLDSLQ